ncbi:hypothetical protein [Bradyrhizobium sp.]|uniref:hypothetical protein n=1 Tax=Bradyrhizobium sp. TaxID=376 RepID=UPI003F8CFBB2
MVSLVTTARVSGSERGFTGTVGARVESNLGSRVAGKIVERLVNVGEQVKAGQPLMRIDETDLRLARRVIGIGTLQEACESEAARKQAIGRVALRELSDDLKPQVRIGLHSAVAGRRAANAVSRIADCDGVMRCRS